MESKSITSKLTNIVSIFALIGGIFTSLQFSVDHGLINLPILKSTNSSSERLDTVTHIDNRNYRTENIFIGEKSNGQKNSTDDKIDVDLDDNIASENLEISSSYQDQIIEAALPTYKTYKYLLKPKDNLVDVVSRHGMTSEEFTILNSELRYGDIETKNTPIILKVWLKYIVNDGDSLMSIAKKFGVGIEDLKLANDKKGNKVVSGELLLIPYPNL